MKPLHICCFAALLFVSLASMHGCSRDTDNAGTIRLGYLQSDLHHLPAFVALEKGFFADEGLKVEVGGIFRAGPEMLSAFAADELDIGYVGLAPAATASLNGVADISILAQVNIEGSAVVCRTRACASLANLRGKTVAIPGHATMQDCLLQKGLRSAGLASGDLRLMVLKPPEMLQSLKAGTIDCFIAWEPYPAQAVSSGEAATIARSRTLWPGHPCCVLIAQSRFASGRSNDSRKILRAHERSCRFIVDHPEEALDIAARYTGMPRAVLEQAIAHMQFMPEIDRGKAQDFAEFLNELGYVTTGRGTKGSLSFFNKTD